MDKVFIYWDNSNVFHGGRAVSAAREPEAAAVRARFRVNLGALLRLALAGRPAARVVMAGSIPPAVRAFWDRVEQWGAKQKVRVELFDRGGFRRKEQQVPDRILQLHMLHDMVETDPPGVAVLLTGDGGGFEDGHGFHADAARMWKRGWRVEILSWENCCSRRMREWAEQNGVFIPLDAYYDAVTFLAPSLPDKPPAPARPSVPLDLSRRPTAK